ncbi:manganese transport system ATP-binding protein [Flavimobilis soli]|uniref:Manganese transport system ATP-binding protein n=1 Tax=Flavimobilis soli TaxID=442709 RepID=A0A2A9E8R1_9MICO|nr:metal ABC transporter ATP-binding protein [Flavimobilis soli]PFG35338.1 manganese transport system ATP-binding protein [Flavimobilis soli]PFG37841.1 manganese transport system ATP-binding protein [Flavimobilis soli]
MSPTQAPPPAAPRAQTPALDVRDLSVRYGDVHALDSASLTLPRGSVTGLVGVNGSGKSTLMRAVVGAVRPTSGTVTILGRPADVARREGALAHLPQSQDVDWTFPVVVRDVVETGRYPHLGPLRRLRAHDRAVVADALERVGLADLADRQVGRLSGGQRQRVFLARAIAQEADVLLLDEPFSGVDKTQEAGMLTLLRELAAEGTSVLVSTHDLPTLPGLVDQVVLLQRRVLFAGPPDEAFAPERLVEAFTGLDLGRIGRLGTQAGTGAADEAAPAVASPAGTSAAVASPTSTSPTTRGSAR